MKIKHFTDTGYSGPAYRLFDAPIFDMQLFYAPPSPFARKVRAAIIELQLQDSVELVLTQVVPGKLNVPYTQQHNPLGKIPALATLDGDTIYDSTVICEYLNSQSIQKHLIPANGRSRWQLMTRHSLAHGICESAVLLRYETFLRPEQHQWQGWIDDQWSKIDRALNWFGENEKQWQGDIDLAQITLACGLAYLDFRTPDHPWRSTHAALGQWYDSIIQRPSFAQTLPTANA